MVTIFIAANLIGNIEAQAFERPRAPSTPAGTAARERGSRPKLPPKHHQVARSAGGRPSLAIDRHGITVKGPDDTTLRIGGRLHTDVGAAGWAPRHIGTAAIDDAAIRRAFIEAYLKVGTL